MFSRLSGLAHLIYLIYLTYLIYLILSIAVDFPLAPLNLYHTGTCLERAFFCASCSSKAACVKWSKACLDCPCNAVVTVVNSSNLSFHWVRVIFADNILNVTLQIGALRDVCWANGSWDSRDPLCLCSYPYQCNKWSSTCNLLFKHFLSEMKAGPQKRSVQVQVWCGGN